MTNKHMRIWEQVEKTNPGDTKEVSFGRKFTAIDAHSQIKKATETFGPVGEGWGYWRSFEQIQAGEEIVILCDAEIWFEDKDKKFPTSGSATLLNNKGKVDNDAFKKSETDAITKGLSKLGFNADVFMGLFDDNKYVESRKKEEAAKRPTGKSRSAMNKEAREIIKEMKASDNLAEYKKSERVMEFIADCKELKDDDTLKTVVDEYKRLKEKPDLSQEDIGTRIDWYINEIQLEKNAETCGTILQAAQWFLKDNGVQHGSKYHQELNQIFDDHCKQLAAS